MGLTGRQGGRGRSRLPAALGAGTPQSPLPAVLNKAHLRADGGGHAVAGHQVDVLPLVGVGDLRRGQWSEERME